MSKHKQWRLKPNQMINLNKRFSDLKEKQKARIAEWLYIETYRFYKEHKHMPNHSERQTVLDTVYDMIEEAEIWIPYKEVEQYYHSKISRYRSRVLRDIENNVTYPMQEKRKVHKTEKHQKTAFFDEIDLSDMMDDCFCLFRVVESTVSHFGKHLFASRKAAERNEESTKNKLFLDSEPEAKGSHRL